MKNSYLLIIAFAFSALLVGCQSNEEDLATGTYSADEMSVLNTNLNLPEAPFSYSFGNTNPGLELDHKGTLGRVLFYDKNLSADASVSCASCHQQKLAFADDKAFSRGANGKLTHRNSIALGSVRSFGKHYEDNLDGSFVPGLFWDERAHSIKEQLIQTINNPNEMGMELAQIVDLVEKTDYYRILHDKAFGQDAVTEDHILEAIETFINSINSANSRLDIDMVENLNYISGDQVTGHGETAFEIGFRLFTNNCSSCHKMSQGLQGEELATAPVNVAYNGLPLSDNDLGIYEHSQNQEDIGKFKVPGLQNIQLTAPYMHDGRFASLEEVVEFYNAGIVAHPNLHPALRDGDKPKRLNLSEEEKAALVDFLKLQTDNELRTNEKWSNPFAS